MGFFEEDMKKEVNEDGERRNSCILSKPVEPIGHPARGNFKVLGDEVKSKKGTELFLDNVRHVVNQRVDMEIKLK